MGHIGDELRQLMADRADAAPTGVGLLAATKHRSRRRLVRRRVAVAGLAGLAVAASGTTLPVVLGALDQPAGPPPAAPAAPNTSASTATRPSSPPSTRPPAAPIRFTPATTQPTVTFPYSPTFVPPGVPKASVFRTSSDRLIHRRQLDDSHWISVELLQSRPAASGTTQAVQVRGHAGTVETSGDGVTALVWPEKPGVWLCISSVGVSRTDLVRYANGLRELQLSGTEALHFTLVPEGMVVHETLHWNMTWARAGSPDNEPEIGVVVNLGAVASHDGTQVPVGNRVGYLVANDDGKQLIVDLGGATLEVLASNGCSDADLLAFAAGITVDLADI